MNLKDGYKLTEIGVIPEEWEVKTVGSCFKIENNLRFPINQQIRNSIQGIYPYYGPTKIQDYINEYRVKGEYALIGEDGDHFLKWYTHPMTLLTSGKFNVNNHAHLIKGNDKDTTTKWFYYYFKNRDITQFLTRQGAGRYKLSKASLIGIPLAIPPLPEQKAIAQVLSDMDNLITGLERQIEKKRLVKQGAMQQLLTAGEDWEVRTLGEVAHIIGGGTPSTNNSIYWNGNIDWFTPTEIGKNKYSYSSRRKITNEGLKNSSAQILPIGTVLLTSRAGIGDLSILKKAACTNQGFQSLVVKEGYNNEYFYYLMNTLKPILLQNASGSTFLEISPNKVRAIEIQIPPLAEQTRIATILSDMDKSIASLAAQLSKYRTIKVGLMQELLSGRKRLV